MRSNEHDLHSNDEQGGSFGTIKIKISHNFY